ncbi:OB-fold-like protein [Raphanus sativus]|nr:OB-fold-like protein [Raphanus sativus]
MNQTDKRDHHIWWSILLERNLIDLGCGSAPAVSTNHPSFRETKKNKSILKEKQKQEKKKTKPIGYNLRREFKLSSELELLPRKKIRRLKKLLKDREAKRLRLDHNATRFTRPASSFRRNSPVPRHKPQSSYSSEAIFDEASSYSVTWTQKKDQVDSQPKLKPESFYHEEDEDHDVIVDELAGDDESINAEEETEKDEDLSALKLIELRAIAKSRGLKGISKMKKAELLNLLCSNKA